jgi:DNA-binding LytR/AlgR family response regulator
MLVDDEPLAQEELTRLLSQDKEFQVVDKAMSGTEALEKMKRSAVDVVFLDIEMPGLNGLEVTAKLAEEWEKPPLVVFATAFDEYAVKAFEAKAIDYVLKPYDPERLKKTLERLKEALKSKKGASTKEKLVSFENYLIDKGMIRKLVGHRRHSKERIIIDPSQVGYFQAKLTELFAGVGEEPLIVRSTLKELLETLDPAHFAQSHKSYIVNLDKVEKVVPMFSGNFEIILKDAKATKVPLSRRYAAKFKRLLGTW